jgi:hypothetical protein
MQRMTMNTTGKMSVLAVALARASVYQAKEARWLLPSEKHLQGTLQTQSTNLICHGSHKEDLQQGSPLQKRDSRTNPG